MNVLLGMLPKAFLMNFKVAPYINATVGKFINFSPLFTGYTKELPPPLHLLNGLAYLVVVLSSWVKSRQVCYPDECVVVMKYCPAG